MYEILLMFCMDDGACLRGRVPYEYATEQRCEMSAAMVAGIFQGQNPTDAVIDYRFKCLPTIGDADPDDIAWHEIRSANR